MSNNKNFKILNKSLPEYLPEFFEALSQQIISDNERWGDTWKERGLVWNGATQEDRLFDWVSQKLYEFDIEDKPFPWLKLAGEAMIGFIREKYLRDNK